MNARIAGGTLAAAAVLASGCAVGPRYEPPAPAVPPAFHQAKAGPATGDEGLAHWWTALGDPQLDQLVEHAVARNHDLREAAARVAEARGLRGIAAGGLAPEAGVSAAAVRQRASETAGPAGVPKGTPNPVTLFDSGFDASWEIDLFGGRRHALEAASADLAAAAEAARGTRASIVAEVVRNYVEWRAFGARLHVADRNVALQEDTLGLAEARFTAGLGSEFDVTRAAAQLASTRSFVPRLRAARTAAANRLAVLLGEAPGTVAELLDGNAAADAMIPRGPESIAPSLPAEVLRRRPDVRRAEREIAAAVARAGVATADLYPRVSLLAALGVRSSRTGSLFESSSRTGALGGTISWPLFQGGRIRANIAAQGARADAAAAAYERTVLLALEDVENALSRHANERERRSQLGAAVAANERAVRLARDLYAHGMTDFLAVLDAERRLYAEQDGLIESEAAVTAQLVSVYKALGGGV